MRRMSLFVVVLALILMVTPSLVAKEKVSLEIWTFVDFHAEYYERMAELFNELHPEIELELTAVTYPFEQMHEKVSIGLYTGLGLPDIAELEIFYAPSMVANGHDKMVDLTDMVEKYRDEIVWGSISPYMYDGKVYGAAYNIPVAVMFYNKELFDEAGISIDDIKTWDDFREAGKKITKDLDGDGVIDQYMMAVTTEEINMWHVLTRQLGSNVFDENGNVIVDCDENVYVAEMLQKFIFEDGIATTISSYHDPNFFEMFNSGKIAAVPNPDWYMSRFEEFMPDLAGKVYVRPLPKWSIGGTTSSTAGGAGKMIFTTSKNIEVAKQYVEFVCLSQEASRRVLNELKFTSNRLDLYEDPEIYQPMPYFGNEIVMKTVAGLLDEIQPVYLGANHGLSETLIQEGLYDMFVKGEDPKTVLGRIADQLR